MKIVKKELLGLDTVYDIGVESDENAHNFLLENGTIASNCFNKAHSVSYSMLTYISAYLKTHYPVYFFTALMSTRSKTLQPKSWAIKAPEYVLEAKKFDIHINTPSVNKSGYEFTIFNNEIYFGLNAIRDVGKTAARCIIKARKNVPFKDILDFVERVNLQKVNTKTFEALAYAGAFDRMGYSRKELIEKTSSIYSYIRDLEDYRQRKIDAAARREENNRNAPLIERRNYLRKEIKKINNRISKDKVNEDDFENLNVYETELEPLEELGLKKLVDLKEKERPSFPELTRHSHIELDLQDITKQAHYIGCYLGGHPLQFVEVKNVTKIISLDVGEIDTIAGVVLGIREINTRKGKKMAVIDVNDSTTTSEIVCFPSTWSKMKNIDLKSGDIVRAKVKVEETDPDYKMILFSLTIVDQNE
jgi:DNA polymerase III alpha subunit